MELSTKSPNPKVNPPNVNILMLTLKKHIRLKVIKTEKVIEESIKRDGLKLLKTKKIRKNMTIMIIPINK